MPSILKASLPHAIFASFNSGLFSSTKPVDLTYHIVTKASGLWPPYFILHMIQISSDWESWLPISPNFAFMPLTLGLQTSVGRRPSWHSFTSLSLYCSKDSELSICSVFNFIHNVSQHALQFLVCLICVGVFLLVSHPLMQAAGFRTIPTHQGIKCGALANNYRLCTFGRRSANNVKR